MRLIEQFYNVIAPNNCLACSTEGKLVCEWCIEDVFTPALSRCYRCNSLTDDYKTCKSCYSSTRIKKLFVATEYSEHVKRIVHKMKFKFSFEAAKIIAEQINSAVPYFDDDTIITNATSITSHVRQRGFDHTERVAKELSKLTNMRYIKLLQRIGQDRQVGARRTKRISQLEHAYRPKSLTLINNAKILLIDDIVTTGATIEAAVHALKDAGAKKVDVAVFSRAK